MMGCEVLSRSIRDETYVAAEIVVVIPNFTHVFMSAWCVVFVGSGAQEEQSKSFQREGDDHICRQKG